MADQFYFNECRECGATIPFGTICLPCLKKFKGSDMKHSFADKIKNIYHCGHMNCNGHNSRFEECYTRDRK